MSRSNWNHSISLNHKSNDVTCASSTPGAHRKWVNPLKQNLWALPPKNATLRTCKWRQTQTWGNIGDGQITSHPTLSPRFWQPKKTLRSHWGLHKKWIGEKVCSVHLGAKAWRMGKETSLFGCRNKRESLSETQLVKKIIPFIQVIYIQPLHSFHTNFKTLQKTCFQRQLNSRPSCSKHIFFQNQSCLPDLTTFSNPKKPQKPQCFHQWNLSAPCLLAQGFTLRLSFYRIRDTQDDELGGWTNRFETYAQVKLDSVSPKDQCENKTHLKPPPIQMLVVESGSL